MQATNNRYISPSFHASGPSFEHPNHFKKVQGRNGRKRPMWQCELCATGRPAKHMSVKAALEHEKGPEHRRNVSANELWTMPNGDWGDWGLPEAENLTQEEKKDNEHRSFVDQLHEFVPFWIKGVEAAERGEVLKMEDFLDENVKYPVHQESYGGWGEPVVYQWPGERRHPKERQFDEGSDDSIHVASDHSHSRQQQGSDVTIASVRSVTDMQRQTGGYDAHAFVEDIALREAAGTERKKQMHKFFEMSTQDKVQRIDDLIRSLHAAKS